MKPSNIVLLGASVSGGNEILAKLRDPAWLPACSTKDARSVREPCIIIPSTSRGTHVKLRLWASSGDELHGPRSFLEDADGAIIIFSPGSKQSAEHAKGWLDFAYVAVRPVQIILCCNGVASIPKSKWQLNIDQSARDIGSSFGLDFSTCDGIKDKTGAQTAIPFFKVDARTGLGLNEMCTRMAGMIEARSISAKLATIQSSNGASKDIDFYQAQLKHLPVSNEKRRSAPLPTEHKSCCIIG